MSGKQVAHPPDTKKGGLHCETELPAAPSKAAITSISLHGITDQLGAAFLGSPGVCRDHARKLLSVRVLRTSVPYPPRHPCHCTRDWTWTQLPEGFQACQGGKQDQGSSLKIIVPSVGTESKPSVASYILPKYYD